MQKNWTFWQRGNTFPLFQLSFQRISGSKDTSFESPYIGRLESEKKNWAWHHPEGGHAPLTEKELLLQGAKKKMDPPILRFSDYIFTLIASIY